MKNKDKPVRTGAQRAALLQKISAAALAVFLFLSLCVSLLCLLEPYPKYVYGIIEFLFGIILVSWYAQAAFCLISTIVQSVLLIEHRKSTSIKQKLFLPLFILGNGLNFLLIFRIFENAF